MARALLGYVGTSTDQALVAEVMRLRRRVAELESELAAVVAEQHHRVAAELDAELRRLADVSVAAAAR